MGKAIERRKKDGRALFDKMMYVSLDGLQQAESFDRASDRVIDVECRSGEKFVWINEQVWGF